MKRATLKQFIVCILTILSLCASSVAACACSHHEKKTESEAPSCHKHSKQKKTEQISDPQFKSVNAEIECTCFQLDSKITAKSGTIKFEKYASAVSNLTPVKIAFVSRVCTPKISFAKPLYLSDSFYNLSPGRAPPVL
jgi:hypothetical protein